MAQFVAAHDALALAQRIGGDLGQVAQVALGRQRGHRRKTAVGLQHQHHAGTGVQQRLHQHRQPGGAELIHRLRIGQGQPGVSFSGAQLRRQILLLNGHVGNDNRCTLGRG